MNQQCGDFLIRVAVHYQAARDSVALRTAITPLQAAGQDLARFALGRKSFRQAIRAEQCVKVSAPKSHLWFIDRIVIKGARFSR